MGMLITGLSLVVLTILFVIFKDPNVLIGFGVGGSLAALFGQIGGGIFTKSADVGADLVGKVEEHIPEDDPRNAAVIADLVGDNVGDCAGRGADLFQTFSDDIITASVVAATLVARYGLSVNLFPHFATDHWCTFLSHWHLGHPSVVARSETREYFQHRFMGQFVPARWVLWLYHWLIHDITMGIAAILGIATTLITASTTRHYAGMNHTPVRKIAQASHRGAALTLMTGTAYGLRSPIVSMFTIICAIILAYRITGGSLLAIIAS